MDDYKSKVYIQTDDRNRIIRCEGGYTTPSDLTGWIYIDEGNGDRYNLCQSHYFDGGLYTDDGIPRYKWDGERAVERTEEEIEADRAGIPVPAPLPTVGELAEENKLLKMQIEAQSEQMDFYEDCIAEMASVVYA